MKEEIIHIGYRIIPPSKIKKSRGTVDCELKYPVDILDKPKNGFNDSMALCEYTSDNMSNINAYIRHVVKPRFPDRKFVLRKEYLNEKNMVVVYRVL